MGNEFNDILTYDAEDFGETLKAAQQGDASAQHLAHCYLYGVGVTQGAKR
jgi:TPR repeat protein